jgi:hypothetical protein
VNTTQSTATYQHAKNYKWFHTINITNNRNFNWNFDEFLFYWTLNIHLLRCRKSLRFSSCCIKRTLCWVSSASSELGVWGKSCLKSCLESPPIGHDHRQSRDGCKSMIREWLEMYHGLVRNPTMSHIVCWVLLVKDLATSGNITRFPQYCHSWDEIFSNKLGTKLELQCHPYQWRKNLHYGNSII